MSTFVSVAGARLCLPSPDPAVVAGPCAGLEFPRWVADRRQMPLTPPHSGGEGMKWEQECDALGTDMGSGTSAVMIIIIFIIIVIIVVPETQTRPPAKGTQLLYKGPGEHCYFIEF